MDEKKYLEDLKNLKPLPLDRPVGSGQSSIGSQGRKTLEEARGQKSEDGKSVYSPQSAVGSQEKRTEDGGRFGRAMKAIDIQQQHSKEVNVESLRSSKTLWGFGIAVFIYVVQNVLAALNVAGPDNLIVKSVIEVVIAIAGFFGVYGVRDALRKMSL